MSKNEQLTLLDISLPVWGIPRGSQIVHRSSRVIIPYIKKPQNPNLSQQISKYSPKGSIINADKLYNQAVSHFGLRKKKVETQLLDIQDTKSENERKMQERTHKIAQKIQSIRKYSDKSQPVIKKEIGKSQIRLRESRNGIRYTPANRKLLTQSFQKQDETTYKIQERISFVNKVRSQPFKKKLEFYQQNPALATRRIQTTHRPWNQHQSFHLPKTPDNQINFTGIPPDPGKYQKQKPIRNFPSKKSSYYSSKSRKLAFESICINRSLSIRESETQAKRQAIGFLNDTLQYPPSSLIKSFFIRN